MKTRSLAIIALLTCAALLAPVASADPIFTFGFTELAGSFDGTNTFDANVDATTYGDVTRTFPTIGTARYDAGFALPADYSMTMTLSNITATTADANGSFIITDADGDTITGDVTGHWTSVNIFSNFVGSLSNVVLNDNGALDGTFDGPSGGSFDLAFPFVQDTFTGAIMTLETGAWFEAGTCWQDMNTLVQASVVPVPGATLLGIVGLGIVAQIRRRLS